MTLSHKPTPRNMPPSNSVENVEAGEVKWSPPLTRPAQDARSLQKSLEERWLGRHLDMKWSARRTLIFVIAASTFLWGLIFALIIMPFL